MYVYVIFVALLVALAVVGEDGSSVEDAAAAAVEIEEAVAINGVGAGEI